MKKIFLLLIFLSISIIELSAQKIPIGKIYDAKYSVIDRLNNIIYIYGESFYKKFNLETFQIDSSIIEIEKEFKILKFEPLIVDSTHYFIHKEGGLVYQKINDSITRIDNSFNHLMQSNSSIFSYNSKIHRFGGYGFWSARNFITYFDNSIKEWEIINPTHSKKVPEEFIGGIHFIIKDDLYVFNGSYNNPFNRYKLIYNEKIWKYNFKDKIWKHLGEIDFVKETTIPNIRYSDKLLIVLSSKIVVIDLLKNSYSEYEKGIKSYYLISNLESFYHNNRFYFFTTDTFGTLYISIATEPEFLGNKIKEKAFYTNNRKLIITVLSVCFLIVAFTLFKIITRLNSRKGKIHLLENGLSYQKNFIPLDEEALKIIKILLETEFVNSSEILKIVEKEQFSRAHNERLKFQKIDELNFKLKTLLNLNETMIKSKKSKFDRRIREYYLHNEFSFYKK